MRRSGKYYEILRRITEVMQKIREWYHFPETKYIRVFWVVM